MVDSATRKDEILNKPADLFGGAISPPPSACRRGLVHCSGVQSDVRGMVQNMTGYRYRVGVDVGDRSVGVAAVEFDEHDVPVRLLAAVSHVHDGGEDPSSGQAKQSRLASAGQARRSRRRFRNRRRRLQRVDERLFAVGCPPIEAGTYGAWAARAELVGGFVDDDARRRLLLGVAVRHMARHRGWRNPWWGFDQLSAAATPSESFVIMRDRAAKSLGVNPAQLGTVGQLGWAASSPDVAMRPRTGAKTLAKNGAAQMFSERIRQEDVLAELRTILSVQQVDLGAADSLCRSVFHAERPHVPIDRVGTDPLMEPQKVPRTTRASLAFQRFRIVAAVANLAGLTDEQRINVRERLLNWREDDPPRWSEVAGWVGLSPREMRAPVLDEDILAVAPTDRTSARIERLFSKKSVVGDWWRTAGAPARKAFVDYLVDATLLETDETVVELLDRLSDSEIVKVESARTTLESGRAAYSEETLARLADRMAETGEGLHSARTALFGVPETWQPPSESLTDPLEHPAVDRVNAVVRKFLSSAVTRWGVPELVVIEHVRSGFLGPAARQEFELELRSNTSRRDRQRAELVQQGVASPARSDLRRYESVQRQNGVCLYCGTGITFSTCELDHIVADSRGGSNRDDNLVAVCRECNADKGTLPFAVWAGTTSRPGVTVDEAAARVGQWTRDSRPVLAWKRLTSRVKQRLSLTSADFEDRSIESTAYAAREIRVRVQTFLSREADRLGVPHPEVNVYRGTVTSQARLAGGVDARLRLRGKQVKSRLDRRHHAVDAAVLTTLKHSVAQVLQERSDRRADHLMTGKNPEWDRFEGSDAVHVAQYRRWRDGIQQLAILLQRASSADRLPVVRSLRLRPTASRVHKDSVEALVEVDSQDVTSAELGRIADVKLRRRVLAGLANGASLTDVLTDLCGARVHLFPSSSPQIQVRGGAAGIGDTAHHARLYAWAEGGNLRFGWVRAFAGEFPLIGFGRGVDVLAEPLAEYSQSWLTAHPEVRRRIHAGDAQMVGWVAVGDEIELSPDRFSGQGLMGRFLAVYPESRWYVSGLPMIDKVSLMPSQLASEGIDETTDEAVAELLNQGRVRLSVGKVFGSDVCVIRRTALGSPRWNGTSGLPACFRPLTVARKKLGL